MSTKTKATPKSKFIAIHSLPKGVLIKGSIIKCSGFRSSYFLSDTGTLYQTGMQGKTVSMPEREKIASYYDMPVLNAFKKLGVVTAAEVTKSVARMKKNEKEQDKRDKENRLRNTAKSLGIPESEVTKLLKTYAS